MELTWVTFPSMVIGVSIAAYFAAFWLKGDELRVNKIDLVDVDERTGFVRGTNWFSLFSPRIEQYDIDIAPQIGQTPQAKSQIGRPAKTVSWLGLAEDAIGGMGRQSGMGIFRQAYRFGPDAQHLEGVPIQVWSMKGFSARWVGQTDPLVKSTLQSTGRDSIEGTVQNLMDVELRDCSIVFRNKLFPVKNLPQGGAVSLRNVTSQDLTGYLRRLDTFQPRRGIETPELAREVLMNMMFYDKIPSGPRIPSSDYFREIDFSHQLDLNQAILIAHAAKPASDLILKVDGKDVQQSLTQHTFVRVVMPVQYEEGELKLEVPNDTKN